LRRYHAAAEQGLAEAKNNLGVMYGDGSGVPKDYTEAARWYRAAAEQGDSEGQYDLATLYAAGRGVPLDYESAYFWYSLAASSGHARSASRLTILSKIMTARQLERTQAKLAVQEKPGERSDKSQATGLLRLPEDK
jgi:TPR repeat protein